MVLHSPPPFCFNSYAIAKWSNLAICFLLYKMIRWYYFYIKWLDDIISILALNRTRQEFVWNFLNEFRDSHQYIDWLTGVKCRISAIWIGAFNIFQVYQHYLQAVLFFIKVWIIFMNILCNKHSLKSGGTKDHFRRVQVPGTTPLLKDLSINICIINTEVLIYLYEHIKIKINS